MELRPQQTEQKKRRSHKKTQALMTSDEHFANASLEKAYHYLDI